MGTETTEKESQDEPHFESNTRAPYTRSSKIAQCTRLKLMMKPFLLVNNSWLHTF